MLCCNVKVETQQVSLSLNRFKALLSAVRRVFFLLLGAFGAISPADAAVPEVVASVRPVHAIVATVMRGIGEPTLLQDQSPSLRAKANGVDARLLARAEIVFWVGPSLEHFLEKSLMDLAGKARVVSLIDTPGLEKRTARTDATWERVSQGAATAHHDPASYDGFIWLNPLNAIAMANVVADTLATADPVNAESYWANAQIFSKEATALDRELHVRLAAVRNKPFLVFHDSYQYFDTRYRLAARGSVNVTSDQPPEPRRVAAIQERLRGVGVVCLFVESEIEARDAQVLVTGTDVRIGLLDPSGARLGGGPGLYVALMRAIASDAERCLR